MLNFGLACEGVTDQIVIENILCGYFHDEDDLDEQINYLQPAFDQTTNKQDGFGGWNGLLEYLTMKRFRDDVVNCSYVVIQVDTDVANNIGFDVALVDENNRELSVAALIDQVVARLVQQIEQGRAGFYDQHQQQIIFAIAVHSTECWLLAHHEPKKHKTQNCETQLKHAVKNKNKQARFNKDYRCYANLSKRLSKHKVLIKTAAIDVSLNLFIQQLSLINRPDID